MLPTVSVYAYVEGQKDVNKRDRVLSIHFIDLIASKKDAVVFLAEDQAKLREYSMKRFGFYIHDYALLFVFSYIEWYLNPFGANIKTAREYTKLVPVMQALQGVGVSLDEQRPKILAQMRACVKAYTGEVDEDVDEESSMGDEHRRLWTRD